MIPADSAHASLQLRTRQDESARLVQLLPETLELALLLLERVLSLPAEALRLGKPGKGFVAFGCERIRLERADLSLQSCDLSRVALEHHSFRNELRYICVS